MVFISGSKTLSNILWLQWIAGTGAMLMLFTLGLSIGWTSPYLAKLVTENTPFPITTDEASWVASLLNLGRFLGAVIGGISVQRFDSKRTVILVGCPVMLAWICIMLANSVNWLYVARFAAGMSMGIAFSSFPIFLGEISSPTIRGALVSFAMMGINLGNLVGNVIGPYISMMMFSGVGLVPNVAFVLLFLWIPQSPHYLVRMGRMEDARRSITRYNPNVDADMQLKSLRDFISASESVTFRDRLQEFNLPRNRKAGLITLALYFFMQFSGLNTVIFYQELILTSAQVRIIPPAMLVMISSSFGVLSGWISIYFADKFERKTLLTVSSVGVGLAMCVFGVHFTLLNNGFDPDTLQWMPILMICFFNFCICSGLTIVPSIVLSEFFAPNIKNLAACFASISLGIFAFTATKSYQPLVDSVGEAFVFFGQATLMVVCIIFAAVFMPQTKGKSLQEIQDSLMRM